LLSIVSACDFSMRDMWITPSSLAWPMIQAARRFGNCIAIVCLLGLPLFALFSSLLGLALSLGGAALWVELSHPKKVDFVRRTAGGRRRGSCGAGL